MRITVFTPTYNRAYLLTRLYESLENQTFRDFEWLVVDDGSTDNTEALIAELSAKATFEIVYLKTENGGKHRAINRGIDVARGELTLFMDSDDWLSCDALEQIDRVESSIPENEKCHYAGVQALRCHTDGVIIGKTFEGDALDCTYIERVKNGITGDKAEVYYTDLMRKYPFPEIEGEKFATERLVWSRIAYDGYIIRYFNAKIYFCEYLEDGLTHGGNYLYAKNPKQWGMAIALDLKVGAMNWYNTSIQYYIYYLWLKKKLTAKEMANNLETTIVNFKISILFQKAVDALRKILNGTRTVKNGVIKEQREVDFEL